MAVSLNYQKCTARQYNSSGNAKQAMMVSLLPNLGARGCQGLRLSAPVNYLTDLLRTRGCPRHHHLKSLSGQARHIVITSDRTRKLQRLYPQAPSWIEGRIPSNRWGFWSHLWPAIGADFLEQEASVSWTTWFSWSTKLWWSGRSPQNSPNVVKMNCLMNCMFSHNHHASIVWPVNCG